MVDRSRQGGASEPQRPEQPFRWPEDFGVTPGWLLHDVGLHRLWKALSFENYPAVLGAFNSGDRDDPDKAVHRQRLYSLLIKHLARRATKSPPHREACARLAQVLELEVPATALRDRYLALLSDGWINVQEGPEEMLADAEDRHRTAWAEVAVDRLPDSRRRALLTSSTEQPSPDRLSDSEWIFALKSLQTEGAARISRELLVSTVR